MIVYITISIIKIVKKLLVSPMNWQENTTKPYTGHKKLKNNHKPAVWLRYTWQVNPVVSVQSHTQYQPMINTNNTASGHGIIKQQSDSLLRAPPWVEDVKWQRDSIKTLFG